MATNPLLRYGPPRQINCTLGISGEFPNYTSGSAYSGTVAINGAQGATRVELVPPGTDASGTAYVPLVNADFAAAGANWAVVNELSAGTFSFQAGAGRTAAGFLRWAPTAGAPGSYLGDTIANTTLVQSSGGEVNLEGWVRCTAIGPQPNGEILDILLGVQIFEDAAGTIVRDPFSIGGSSSGSRRISGVIDWFPLRTRVNIPAGTYYRLAFQCRAGTSGTVEFDDCQWDARGVPSGAPSTLGLPSGFTIDTLASPDRVRVQWPGIPVAGQFFAAGLTAALPRTYITSSDGISWSSIQSGLNDGGATINSATVYAANGIIYLAAMGAANTPFAYSTDAGATWQRGNFQTSSIASDRSNTIIFNAGTYFLPARGSGILTSTNGVTWTPNAAVQAEWIVRAGANLVLSESGVFEFSRTRYSTNNGATWIQSSTELGAAQGWTNAILFSDGSRVFVHGFKGGGFNNNVGGFSDDGGVTFTQVASPFTSTARTLQGAVGGGIWVMVTTAGEFAFSTNGGASWTLSADTFGGTPRALFFGNGIFVAVGDGGIVRTSVNGNNWTTRSTAYSTTNLTGGAFLLGAGGGGATSTLTNLGFEAGDVNWLKGAGWSITNAAPVDAGSWSAKYSGLGQSSLVHETMAPVTPGTSITASCRVSKGNNRKDFAGGAVLLEWLDANTRPLGFNVGNVINTGTAAFQTSTVTATAPAGAAFVRLGASGSRDVKGRASDAVAVDGFAWNHTFALGGSGGSGGTATPTTGPVALTFRVTDSVGCSAVATRTISQA